MTAIARHLSLPVPSLLSLGLGLFRLAGIGLIAIGISGLIALGAGSVFGKDFISGDPPDRVYTAERCADFREYVPASRSCEEAATEHHFQEVIGYRLAAGLMGLLLLGGLRFLVPRLVENWARPLPAGIIEAAGATAFGLAAAGLFGLTLSRAIQLRPLAFALSGAGMYLTGAIVAFPLGAYYSLEVLRVICREPAEPTSPGKTTSH